MKRLAQRIGDYSHRTEGRGNNGFAETLRRDDLDYFFAYPEDYSQQSVEWVGGEFQQRPHNPGFELAYAYARKDGTPDVNVGGSNKVVRPRAWRRGRPARAGWKPALPGTDTWTE